MMRTTDKHILNPCPICGCSVRVWAKRFDEEDVEYIIECDNDFCGLTYGISCGYNCDEIKKAWNSVTALSSTISGDCISREWVLDKLNEQYKVNRFKAHNDMANEGIGQAESIIENAPSVTPTERAGEWISLFDGNEWFIHCSKCKTQHYEEDLLMGGSELPNFCPHCGADMKGEE